MQLNKKRTWLALAFFLPLTGLIIVSIFGLFFADDPTKIPTVFIQKEAPIFTLYDLDGEQASLSDYSKQPVILNFWASWCVPCKEEVIELNGISKRYKNKGLVVLGVAVNDSLENLLKFRKDFKLSFKSFRDTDAGDIMLEYGVTGIPETFFISPDGIVEQKIYGAVTFNEMEKFVKKYIQ